MYPHSIFSPFWRGNILVGPRRKHLGSTINFPFSPPNQTHSKKVFFSYFLSKVFHPPCFTFKQTHPLGCGCSFPRSTKKFSFQNGEKNKGRKWNYLMDRNAMCTCTWAIHPIPFFFFLVLSWAPCLFLFLFLFPFSFPGHCLFFLSCGCDSCFVCFFFWLTRHDFYFFGTWFLFFNKLGDCLFFGCLLLFCFNWPSFFNKSVRVNLYKFTFFFPIPPLFYSQSNKNERN